MTTLITGGTGFTGSFLARHLTKTTNEDLILFDYIINEKRIHDLKDNSRVKIIQGNLSSWSEITKLSDSSQGIDNIFHFGSLMPPFTETSTETAFQVNIQGTFNILEFAHLSGASNVFYASSAAVYSPGVDLPITEKSYREPLTMYGVGKVCSEVMGVYYRRRKNINFLTLRFPAIIGPGRSGAGMTIYANNIIQFPAQGMKAICNVEPDITIPILYIKDVTRLLGSLLEHEDINEPAYNLDGFWVSAQELAHLVQKEIPEAVIEYEPDSELSILLRFLSMMEGDDALVRKDLEFNPIYTPEKLVKDFILEVQRNPNYKV
ncbi:MAG: NAD(P)-dependent oxidoreductase [Candidatus Heimdallarchaeota archaeon]|nr:MAG: NAD(P)-dependent oxidoreductase [Candidatus Heimdallarchaeota archaeon]